MDGSSGKGGATAVHMNDAEAETRSTISSSELLPAYSPRLITNPAESTAIAVAKLISRTLLLITLIVSLLVLVTVYIQSKNQGLRCEYGLRASESSRDGGAYFEPLTSDSGDSADFDGPPMSSGGGGAGRKIPISIRMSGRAGDLMNAAPNGKGHVNCVIERKTANQIIASEPKKLITPYGNITTDPRLIHLTGEKLVFSCHSGDKEDGSGGDQREKDVIIITSNKEVMDPRDKTGGSAEDGPSDPKDGPDGALGPQTSKEAENELNSINGPKSRAKREAAASKDMMCNCSC